MKTFISTFNKIAKNQELRVDFGMHYVSEVLQFNPFSLTENNSVCLSEIISPIQSKKIKKGDLEEEEYLIELDGIEKRFNKINPDKVVSINSDKVILENGDLVIAKMTPRLGTMFLNLEHNKYLGSSELVEYIFNKPFTNPYFIFYILTSNKFLDVLGYLESGKNQRRVKPSDILKILIPNSFLKIDNDLKLKINELDGLLKQRKDIQKIIDSSFSVVTKIPVWEEDQIFFKTNLKTVGSDNLLRFSYHNQSYFKHFSFKQIETKEWEPIEKKFIVTGGKRVPKGDTFSNVETDYFYLRPNEVSLLGIDRANIPYLRKDTFDILYRYRIVTGDFCVSNVGTLGKVGFVDTDKLNILPNNLILSENFVKLKPITTVNNEFYYYYFNSYIFKAQIQKEYTITTVMKLGLDKIKKFKIPNFDLDRENQIISLIKQELTYQRELFKKIETKRDDIDALFYSLN